MKKVLVALSILMAFLINTQASFATCPLNQNTYSRKHIHHTSHFKRKHHMRKSYYKKVCPSSRTTGAACPVTNPRPYVQPCGCPCGAAAPCPCQTPSYNDCCD